MRGRGAGVFLVFLGAALTAAAADAGPKQSFRGGFQVAQNVPCSATCGRVSSCREAVYLWCVCGYRRADRDRDGVPCESLCGQSTPRNLSKVRQIMLDLGCR